MKYVTRKADHGMRVAYPSEHQSWRGMIERCTNPNHASWKWYGGRGVTVCQRWLEFHNFVADMAPRPVGRTLDRINANAGYCPDNCRWADSRTQFENSRNHAPIDIGSIFGRLTVTGPREVKLVGVKNPEVKAHYKCTCVCGCIVTVAAGNLKNGSAQSCGCRQRESAIKSNKQRAKSK